MRSVPAVALSIALAPLASAGSWAANGPAPTPPPATPAAAGGSASADNEAAARHARLTACINQARAKKLVGAQKTAYIKSCVGTP